MYYGHSKLLVVALLQHLMEWLSWSVVFLSTSNITLTPLQQAAVLEIGHTALPHSGQKLSPEFSSEPHSPQDLALSCVLEAHSSL